jgi:hypothetical protein
MQVMFLSVTFHLPTSSFGVGLGVGLVVGEGGWVVPGEVVDTVVVGVVAGVVAGVVVGVVGASVVMIVVVSGLTVEVDLGKGWGGPDNELLSAPVYQKYN